MAERTAGQKFDLETFERMFGPGASKRLAEGLGHAAADEPEVYEETVRSLRGIVRALLPYIDQAETGITDESTGDDEEVSLPGLLPEEDLTERLISIDGASMLVKIFGDEYKEPICSLSVAEAANLIIALEDLRFGRTKDGPFGFYSQKKILKLIMTAEGFKDKDIARELGVDNKDIYDVRWRWTEALSKLGINFPDLMSSIGESGIDTDSTTRIVLPPISDIGGLAGLIGELGTTSEYDAEARLQGPLPEKDYDKLKINIKIITMFTNIFGERHRAQIGELTISEALQLYRAIELEKDKFRRVRADPDRYEAFNDKILLSIKGSSTGYIAERHNTTTKSIYQTRRQWADRVVEWVGDKLPSLDELLERSYQDGFAVDPEDELPTILPIVSTEQPKEAAVEGGEYKSVESLVENIVDEMILKLGLDPDNDRDKMRVLIQDILSRKVYERRTFDFTVFIKSKLEMYAPQANRRYPIGLSENEWKLLASVSGLNRGQPRALANRYNLVGPSDGLSGKQIVQTKFLSALLKLLTYEPNTPTEEAKGGERDDSFLV